MFILRKYIMDELIKEYNCDFGVISTYINSSITYKSKGGAIIVHGDLIKITDEFIEKYKDDDSINFYLRVI